MQVVPICIVACLLVVSLSGFKVHKQGECHRLNRAKYMTINNKRARCQCKVDNNGNKVWMCRLLIGCRHHFSYYEPGEKQGGCECMKRPNVANSYYWFCTECLHGPQSRFYKIDAIWTDQASKEKCTCAKLSLGKVKVICQNAACNRKMNKHVRKTALGKCTCSKGAQRWKCP